MKNILVIVAALCLATIVLAAPPERYLHVKVDDPHNSERVRINIPLSLAEKVIPAINTEPLHGGKIRIRDFQANGVDLGKLLDAVKTAPDGEFVTVEDQDNNVRVAKSNGTMIVHVLSRDGKEKVDVTVPWQVAEAVASSNGQEIDLEAVLHALENAGDTTLVTVTDHGQTVRVWVDSRNATD